MAEFPDVPAPPLPRKSNAWKIVVPIVIVVLLCCCCLAVLGVLAYLGTQGTGPFASLQNDNPFTTTSQSVVGDWSLYYDWSCSENYKGPVTVTFHTDGTYYAEEGGSGGYGTWELAGNTLDYVYNEYPNAHYIGTVNSSRDHVNGTMSTSDNSSGCFYADKK